MEERKAYFGGGCFWCTEAVFQRLKGVVKIKPGYAGGQVKHPTYKEVCSGLTGHAELIEITYNSAEISLETLLDVFFATHDPTTLNRQGNDVGTQYRSVIYYNSEAERDTVKKYIADSIADLFDAAIVTEIAPLDIFYPAEDYHHDYYNQNSHQGYCRIVINPKIEKLKKSFTSNLA